MKILHTSDWHVGKVLGAVPPRRAARGARRDRRRSRPRAGRPRPRRRRPVRHRGARRPRRSAVVWDALLALRATGARVVVIAGNHDHGTRSTRWSPVGDAAGITLLGPRDPAGARRRHRVHDERRRGVGSCAAVRVPAVRGPGRTDVRARRGGPRRSVRRSHARLIAALTDRLRGPTRSTWSPRTASCAAASSAAASATRTRSTTTASRPRPSRRRRTTSRSATCTGRSRWPAPRRPGTRARRSRSTSARKATPSTCSIVDVRDRRAGARSRRVPLSRRGRCAPSAARSPSCEAARADDRRRVAAGRRARAGARRPRRRRARAASRARSRSGSRSPASDRRRPGTRTSASGRTPQELFAEYLASEGVDDARVERLFDSCTTSPSRRGERLMRPLAPGPAGLHRVPRTDRHRLRRRRLLRARRADRLGQVHRDRRDLLRALRHRAAYGDERQVARVVSVGKPKRRCR